MNELTERLEDLIASSSALLVQVGDESCAPCHALRRKIDEWAERHPDVVTRYVPLDAHREACAQMGVMSVPTVIGYVDELAAARELVAREQDECLRLFAEEVSRYE